MASLLFSELGRLGSRPEMQPGLLKMMLIETRTAERGSGGGGETDRLFSLRLMPTLGNNNGVRSLVQEQITTRGKEKSKIGALVKMGALETGKTSYRETITAWSAEDGWVWGDSTELLEISLV